MTSLAKQLLRLSLPENNFGNVDDRSRPSLLFDSKLAATFGKDTFYALGLTGFQELCAVEPNLHGLYFDILFSEVAKEIERSVASKNFNTKLDKSINSFLLYVSPYFLLRSTQKCLEWLIYRFRIHSFNINSLLKCALPYYNTKTFVRLLQLIDVRKSSKQHSWISEAQASGRPLTIKMMINYCVEHSSFLSFLGETLCETIQIHSNSEKLWLIKVILNLFTSLVLGIIHTMDIIPETKMLLWMPILMKGLKSNLVDYQASSFMTISLLAIKVVFQAETFRQIVNTSIRYCHPQLQKELLFFLSQLFQNQDSINILEKRSFDCLVSMESFLTNFVFLIDNGQSNHFFKVFLNYLIPQAIQSGITTMDSDINEKSEIDYSNILRSLIKHTSLQRNTQTFLFELMIVNFSEIHHTRSEGENISKTLQDVLDLMQRKYPDAFDMTILHLSKTKSVSAQSLYRFLSGSFLSVKHQMLPDGEYALSYGLVYGEPVIRCQALKHIKQMISTKQLSGEIHSFIQQSVVDLFSRETNDNVLVAALELILDHAELFAEKSKEIVISLIKIIGMSRIGTKVDLTATVAMTCLTNGKLTPAQNGSSPFEDMMENRITVFLLELFVRSLVCSGNTRLQDLKKIAVGSEFCKKNNLLNKVLPALSLSQNKGAAVENFISMLVETVKNETSFDKLLELLCIFPLNSKISKENTSIYLLLVVVSINIGQHCPKLFFSGLCRLFTFTKLSIKHAEETNCYPRITEKSINDIFCDIFVDTHDVNSFEIMWPVMCEMWHNAIVTIGHFLPTFQDDICIVEVDMLNFLNMTKIQNNAMVSRRGSLSRFIFILILDMSRLYAQQNTFVMEFIRRALTSFCDVTFNAVCDSFSFFSDVLQCHLQTNDEERRYICYQLIYIISAIAESLQGKPIIVDSARILETSSSVIPALLLACTYSDSKVRAAAIQCLKILSKLKSCSLVNLTRFVVNHSEGIIIDDVHCSKIIAKYFQQSGEKCSYKTKLLKDLILNHVVSSSAVGRGINFYKKCLCEVSNAAEMQVLFPTLEAILKKCLHQPSEISKVEAMLVETVLKKTTSMMVPDFKYLELFSNALKINITDFTKVNDESFKPQVVAMGLVTSKFYLSLPETMKRDILQQLIHISATSSSFDAAVRSMKTFKIITIHSDHVIEELNMCKAIVQAPCKDLLSIMAAKRKSMERTPEDMLQEDQMDMPKIRMKKFMMILEMLQHKKKIIQPQKLIGPLFGILNNTFSAKMDSGDVDYMVSLILGCLTNVFKRSQLQLRDPKILDLIKSNVKVELLVKCIHSTENTLVHQHALLLISEAATVFPEEILHSVMSVFTFMGNSLLRRDDSYSFQIITRTIHTVIPPLTMQTVAVKDGDDPVLKILRVFVDAIPHIPSHRRLTVFEELLNAVSTVDYLWKTLVMSIYQHFAKTFQLDQETVIKKAMELDKNITSNEILENLLAFWCSVCNLYDSELQIQTIKEIVAYLSTLTDDKENEGFMSGLKQHSPQEVCRFCIMLLTFSTQAVFKLKLIWPEKLDKNHIIGHNVTLSLERLLKHTLLYHCKTLKNVKRPLVNEGDVTWQYKKCLISKVNELLDKIITHIPTGKFLSIVHSLLSNELEMHQFKFIQKLLQLFDHYISRLSSISEQNETELLLQLSGLCRLILMNSSDEAAICAAVTSQTKIIRVCGMACAEQFAPLIPVVCDYISDHVVSDITMSAMLMCLGELCITIKAHCIAHLSSISFCLIKLLDQWKNQSELVIINVLTTVSKLFGCLGHFLYPYLVDFITRLSILHFNKQHTETRNPSVEKLPAKRLKHFPYSKDKSLSLILSNVFAVVSCKLESRVLIPTFGECLDKVAQECPLAASSLLQIICNHMDALDKLKLSQHATALMSLLLNALDFRTIQFKLSLQEVENVENIAIDCVISLLLKLPETAFRPLYLKLYEWGCNPDTAPTRETTFYRCTTLLAMKLKGLFELFAQDLLDHVVTTLQGNIDVTDLETSRNEEECICRFSHAVETLRLIILYSSPTFLTTKRFEIVLHPLVDQLKRTVNNMDLLDCYIVNRVIPCIGQLAATTRDITAWKPLNYHLLMKTRHASSRVRCYALDCLQNTVEKFGEDYSILLPETIPFLSELLEDENDLVVKRCQTVVRRMEEVLGEPLQKQLY